MVYWQFKEKMLLMEKKYLYALMEECLQSMDSGCDLVGEVEKMKKLENCKEM